jgi:ubiquitin carboxyl-terminal hydrolase 25/28
VDENLDRKGNEMDIESPISESPMDKDGFVMISCKDTSPPVDQAGNPGLEASTSKTQIKEPDENDESVPKTTPRKRVEPSDSTMMFG